MKTPIKRWWPLLLLISLNGCASNKSPDYLYTQNTVVYPTAPITVTKTNNLINDLDQEMRVCHTNLEALQKLRP